MKDDFIPKGKWEFDGDVTERFDNMIERSIPGYADMRDLVFRVGKNYIIPKTNVVDIGCSTGEAIRPFISKYGAQNQYTLYDVSAPMLEECRKRYAGYIENGIVSIEDFDIRNGIKKTACSLCICVLTLQFTPIEYRQKILKSIYNSLITGGALVIVEKVLGKTYDIDEMFIHEYYDIKRENAYTEEQIRAKRKSLEGVLVPISSAWMEQLLEQSGFSEIDCFWRFLNFAGWIAIK